jgi:peptidoglycan/xylan/chitin deacetylase (PgdA/CDA1 family)
MDIDHARFIAKRSILRMVSVVCQLDRSTPDSILLTFDDGPHPETTPAVLDRLEKYGARAIFFVVGSRVSRAPEILSEIVSRGHVIGNHTFSHPLSMVTHSYREEIIRCQDVIGTIIGKTPTLFRPPFGKTSMRGVLAAQRLGLKTVHWSLDRADWALRDQATARACGE